MSESLSFATDIKPMFREKDRREMEFMFDLWDYQDVCDNANEILGELRGAPCPAMVRGRKRTLNCFGAGSTRELPHRQSRLAG